MTTYNDVRASNVIRTTPSAPIVRGCVELNAVGTLATPRATIREPATPPHSLLGMLDRMYMYTAVAANALTFWIVQDEQKLRIQAKLDEFKFVISLRRVGV